MTLIELLRITVKDINMSVTDIIKSGCDDDKNKDFTFYLDGDLCQMSAQKDFLQEKGIETQQNNVYPCVRECDKEKALSLIWEFRCKGWWHDEKQFVELGICTKEKFWKVLRATS